MIERVDSDPLSYPLGCAALDNQAHTTWSNVSPRNISRMVQGGSRSKTPSKGDSHREQINTSEIQPRLLDISNNILCLKMGFISFQPLGHWEGDAAEAPTDA